MNEKEQTLAREIVVEAENLYYKVNRRLLPAGLRNLEISEETRDYGRKIVHMMALRIARLPQKGTLSISTPSRPIDHVLQGVKQWLVGRGWWRLSERIRPRMSVTVYEAAHYLPAIDLPPEIGDGDFLRFRFKYVDDLL